MAGDLILGPVLFRGFEVPERIRFGGKQRVAVHRTVGGGRVVEVLGDDDAPIIWNGVFSGADAAARVRVLEQLRRAGQPLLLCWEAWRYTVVLEVFEAEGVNPAWIPYSIRACVVESADAALPVEAALLIAEAEAVALGAGPGLDGRIAAASAGLAVADVATAIAASGTLARLVTAQAFAFAAGNVS